MVGGTSFSPSVVPVLSGGDEGLLDRPVDVQRIRFCSAPALFVGARGLTAAESAGGRGADAVRRGFGAMSNAADGHRAILVPAWWLPVEGVAGHLHLPAAADLQSNRSGAQASIVRSLSGFEQQISALL